MKFLASVAKGDNFHLLTAATLVKAGEARARRNLGATEYSGSAHFAAKKTWAGRAM